MLLYIWFPFFLLFLIPSLFFSNSSGTVRSAPTTNGITVTFMYRIFLSTQAGSKYLSIFSFLSFPFGVLLELLLFYSFGSFHTRLLIVFHRSLNNGTYPQVSRTLFSILANLKSAVVWMVTALFREISYVFL